MEITAFKQDYIEDARKLAMADYERERCYSSALPEIAAVPELSSYAKNGLGVAALEKGRLVGFLCVVPPFANCFGSTDAVGVFSPMGANGALAENREAIYARMIQKGAALWKQAGASNHALCFYAHDTEAQRQSFYYGYGLRCMDAIRRLESAEEPVCPGYRFRELATEEFVKVGSLERMLDRHMEQSPTFIRRPSLSQEEARYEAKEQEARYFAADCQGQLAAYLRVARDGETFLCSRPDYIHVDGAYCLPEHRGNGVAAGLLQFVMNRLAEEGRTYIGVDFESINPVGHRFWRKHFQIYTHSLARRIDEHVIEF